MTALILSHKVNSVPSGGSRRDEILGEFDHASGLLRTYFQPTWLQSGSFDDLIDELCEQAKNVSPDQKLDFLLRRTVIYHELRHFHDAFFTPLGVHVLKQLLFSHAYFHSAVMQITAWCRRLGQHPYPLSRYFVDPALPSHTAHVAHIARHSWLSCLVDMAVEPLARTIGKDMESDFYVVNLKDEFGAVSKVPCVSTNVLINDVSHVVLWPLSFSLITEALAQLVQESWITCVDERLRLVWRQELRASLNPYLPIITTYIRIFRSRGVSAEHTTDEILFEMLSQALFLFHRSQTSLAAESCPGGWELISLLENNCDIEHGRIEWRPPGQSVDDGKWAERDYPQEFPLLILSHVLDHYFVPAQTVIRSIPYSYISKTGYLASLGALPKPPLVMTLDGDLSIHDSLFHRLWMNWVLYRHLLDDAIAKDIMVCPVRHPVTSNLFPRAGPLPSGDTCRRHLPSLTCGVWETKSNYRGPDCVWRMMWRQLAPETIQATDV